MAGEKAGPPRILKRRHLIQVEPDTREWIEELLIPQVDKGLTLSTISKIDPIRIAAVAGLAVVLKPVMAGASDLMGWYGKLFDGLGLAISGQFTPEDAGNILFDAPFVGGLYRSLFGAFLPSEVVEQIDPTTAEGHNELLEWLLAISAASLIVILGPSAIGLIRP